MSDTLLDYVLFPNPDPLQASTTAALTLVVSNGGRAPVTVQKIVVTLPVGTNASDLTAQGKGITVMRPDKWSATNNEGEITLTPEPAAATIGGAGVTFTFAGIAVNAQPGLCSVTIDETVAGAGRSATIPLPKLPEQFFLSQLSAHLPDVEYGASTTLQWSGTAGSTYALQYRSGGAVVSESVGNNGPHTVSKLTANTLFTLEVSVTVPGVLHPVLVQRQVAVTVTKLELEIAAEPTTVGVNGLVRLRWTTENARSCILEPGTRALGSAGDAWLTVAQSETLTVTAKGPGDLMKQRQLGIKVDPKIVPTTSKSAKGSDGAGGQDGKNADSGRWGSVTAGRPGGDGGDAVLVSKLPPIDPSSTPRRVMGISVIGGAGGAGGRGGSDFRGTGLPIGPGADGGDGGNGGNARFDGTFDPTAGEPAQFIVQVQAGRGGAGGAGGFGNTEGSDGRNGRPGTASMAFHVPMAAKAAAVTTADDQPLLQYAILTTPDPLQTSAASVTLMLAISSAQRGAVTVIQIDVNLPVGTSAQTLTPDTAGIQTLPNSGWTVSDQTGGTYRLTPNTAADAKVGGAGLLFTFARLRINDQPGTAGILISETASVGGGAAVERDTTINVFKFPQQFFLSQLLAEPTEVAYGGGTTLTWSGTPDAAYTLSYDPGNGLIHVPVTNSGPFPAAGLVEQTVFTLRASVPVAGQDHPMIVQRQVTVTIQPQLAVTSFTTSATSLAAGESLTLAWHTVLASGCAIMLTGLAGSVDVSGRGGCTVSSPRGDALVFTTSDGATVLGSIDVPSTATMVTFVLAASGAGASVEADLHVQLRAAHIDDLRAFNRYHTGRTVVVWLASNAVDCRLDSEAVGTSGRTVFADGGYQVHTLVCRGFGGEQTASAAGLHK